MTYGSLYDRLFFHSPRPASPSSRVPHTCLPAAAPFRFPPFFVARCRRPVFPPVLSAAPVPLLSRSRCSLHLQHM
ncbi:hypothetical protein VTO73DRAFT_13370 [Trametes versicolor]